MLKARAVVIGEKDAVRKLLQDPSARRSWSLSAIEGNGKAQIEELLADIRKPARTGKPRITAVIVDGYNKQAKDMAVCLNEVRERGIAVVEIDDFYEKYLKKLNIFSKNGSAHVGTGVRHPLFEFSKRALDVFFALLALILLAPLFVLVSILIKLDSPGRVLYLQRRVGIKNKEFTVYKFRTMVQEAEKDKAVWAELDDPRVTKLGRLLRRLRIDELPQLLNILKGEMSIVGPRPERPEFVRKLRQEIPHYDERHQVKPGLTGWAQVNFRYGASVDDAAEKLKYDLFYLKHRTILLDLYIMLKTIIVVVKGKGR